MSHPLPRRFAINAALIVAACAASAAWAAPSIVRTSGPLLAYASNGAPRVVAAESRLRAGDRVATGADTYAEVALDGGGTATLAPDSEVRFEDRKLTLSRGGVQVASGRERVLLETPEGSLDIRDARVLAVYSPPAVATASLERIRFASLTVVSDAIVEPLRLAATTPVPGSLAPGLYVQVLDGIINLSNKGGSAAFTAGQFGYTASANKPPVVVPPNPGIKFTPPPAFSSTPTGNTSGSRAAAVDCVVR
jgi:hypothetical protein